MIEWIFAIIALSALIGCTVFMVIAFFGKKGGGGNI